MKREVRCCDGLHGALQVPGDKSIAHRALILGAMADGEQRVRGLPPSEDLASTARCLRALGCRIEEDGAGGAVASGAGRLPRGAAAHLDAGNSGTTARLLSGLAAGWGLDVTLDGDDSLRRRPMRRIADPMAQMNVEVTSRDGRLPMRLRPRGEALTPITYHPPAASAQVKSAILIAGLFAPGTTTVVEKAATRDHTERMLAAMGAVVTRDGLSVSVQGGARLRPAAVDVPGDISSAAFFLVAASITPGSELRLRNVGVNPTRTGVLEALRVMGADITLEPRPAQAGEPVADLVVRTAPLRGVAIGGALIPRLIDELPVLAVAASQAEGETVVRDAGELRHKESDRIRLTVDTLAALGADIRETADGFAVRGPRRLSGVRVSSGGDHRIAMAAAVAALVADGATRIDDSAAVAVSYPGFFDDLDRLRR